MTIHERALIHPSVEIDPTNDIGPNVIIEEGVSIGRGNRILPNAYLARGTTLGDENVVHMSAVIGHVPQDLAFPDEPSYTRIGHRNVIREFVSVHRGTAPASETVIGDDCYLMAGSHVAHNCRLGNGVIMVNASQLAGHIELGDRAFVSGLCGFHQFVRIGKLAMISGGTFLNQDAPPYMTTSGRPGEVTGVNIVGVRRAGLDADARRSLQAAYRTLFRSDRTESEALEALAEDPCAEVRELVKFVAESTRGLSKGGGGKNRP